MTTMAKKELVWHKKPSPSRASFFTPSPPLFHSFFFQAEARAEELGQNQGATTARVKELENAKAELMEQVRRQR